MPFEGTKFESYEPNCKETVHGVLIFPIDLRSEPFKSISKNESILVIMAIKIMKKKKKFKAFIITSIVIYTPIAYIYIIIVRNPTSIVSAYLSS